MRTPLFAILLLALSTLACATSPRVSVEPAAGSELARFETFALVSDLDTQDNDPAFGPELRDAVRGEVVAGLTAAGLREVPRDEADLLVRPSLLPLDADEHPARITTHGGVNVYTQTTSLRTPAGSVLVARSTAVAPRTHTVVVEPGPITGRRALVLDLFDAESEDLVWRGSSTLRSARRTPRVDRVRDHARAIVEQVAESR